MKLLLPIIILFVITNVLYGIRQTEPRQIVGYSSTKLQTGNNRIEINFDAVKPFFSTLDMVIKFEPAEGVIGDEIIFPLDGKMRRYRFNSFDGTNYVLSAVNGEHRFTTTLDAIPWISEFWLNHYNGKDVSIGQAGIMGGKYEQLERQLERDTKQNAPITVTLVGSKDPLKPKKLLLKGGHIRLGE